jgi:predicted protein tyrosine phosphatase
MKKIAIAGQAKHARSPLKKVLETDPKGFDVIVINGPEDVVPDYVHELGREHLHLQFDDVIYDYGHMVKPERHHVEKALEWAKGRENIVVACAAGISRSSATALAIVVQEHGILDAFSILHPELHEPNKRIVYLASKILGKPELWDEFVKWKEKHHNDSCASFKKWFDTQGGVV